MRLPRRVPQISELAVQRLEILPADRVTVVDAQVSQALADPRPGGLAALLDRGQVIAGAPLSGERLPLGGAHLLPRVGRVHARLDADHHAHRWPPPSAPPPC